ncbi:hypothetical protein [Lacticaseibacillus yichunensis]|uniref:Competence protein ComGF n=1 Tax=Lacticaseibacillus yichunensis TaxID=2486015 RepID=A0ABW4CQ61_9LACO|nr:hypothetical protein [Lacticaseibacillus yichunensis]
MNLSYRGMRRRGNTMVEAMIAVALFVGVVLLWRPVLRGFLVAAWLDRDYLLAMSAQTRLEEMAQQATTMTINHAETGDEWQVTTSADSFIVSAGKKPTGPYLYRTPGFNPLVIGVAKWTLEPLANGEIEWTFKTPQQIEFSGILSQSPAKERDGDASTR